MRQIHKIRKIRVEVFTKCNKVWYRLHKTIDFLLFMLYNA